MGALWTTADPLTQHRLNRQSIVGRLLLPLYDEDKDGIVTVAARPLSAALTTASAAYYTVPGAGVAVAEVLTITLVNTDAVAQAVSVYLVESGGTSVVATKVFADTLQPGEVVALGGPWFLAPGDMLQAGANAAGVVSIRADVLEYAAQPAGLTLKVINGAALGAGLVTYYTTPAAGVRQALLLAATLCNSDAVSRRPHLHVVPNGGAAVVANRIWSDSLTAKETVIDEPRTVLDPGDFIQALADVAAVVSLRLTVLEVA